MSFSEDNTSSSRPQQYDLTQIPRNSFSTTLLPDNDFPHNFTRVAKWCSDGSVALAQCENRSFQTLHLPPDVHALNPDHNVDALPTINTNPAKVFHQPSPILDFAWYPTASIWDPASFCFVASVRECPVKLMDASDGRLRASYRIVDHRERQIAPHSLAFNTTSDKLYCGFEDAIEVFDVQRPGEGTRLHTTPSKKSRDGLKGIISALAFSADASSGVYAAGSLSPPSPSSSNIALFSEATGEVPVLYVGADNEHDGHFAVRASVMQLMFNPARPYMLYASFRRKRTIYSWDLRGNVSSPVQKFGDVNIDDPGHVDETDSLEETRELTNQKMRFDIDNNGSHLAIGHQNGALSIFDLTESSMDVQAGTRDDILDRASVLKFAAHEDAVGTVAFHPSKPLLLSASGSRHFSPDALPEPGSSPGSNSTTDDETSVSTVIRRQRQFQPHILDNSVKFWDFGSSGVLNNRKTNT